MRVFDFEFCFLGLLIVAVTFYAGLALRAPSSSAAATGSGLGNSSTLAALVLGLLPLPYAAFLWWLTLARAVRKPQTQVSVAPGPEAWMQSDIRSES